MKYKKYILLRARFSDRKKKREEGVATTVQNVCPDARRRRRGHSSGMWSV